jgi:hypothetical protein
MNNILITGLIVLSSNWLYADDPLQSKLESENRIAPMFPVNANWFGSKSLTWEQLKGKVVLIHFWSAGDSATEANLAYFASWKEKHEGNGLRVIGFHVPSPDFDGDNDKLLRQVKKISEEFPNILDSQGSSLELWNATSVPTFFLVDRSGRIRYKFEGPLAWKRYQAHKQVGTTLEALLKEKYP